MFGTLSAQQETSEPRRRRDKDTTSWMVGVVLILLGFALILANAGYVVWTGNWWAIFIYLAGFASFANAWRSYRSSAQFGSAATGSLIWGLVLTVVASILLFDLSWDRWWPIILVVIGIGIVVGNVLGARTSGPGDGSS